MKYLLKDASVNSLKWWRVPGSNRWPPACKAGALPAELTPHIGSLHFFEVVGQNGLEPSTSRLSVVCSSQLSYWPIRLLLVEISGIEPLTSCLQGRRSPSWAKPPNIHHLIVNSILIYRFQVVQVQQALKELLQNIYGIQQKVKVEI